jgi:hypothetical protein
MAYPDEIAPESSPKANGGIVDDPSVPVGPESSAPIPSIPSSELATLNVTRKQRKGDKPLRDAKGRLLKGQSANPYGPPDGYRKRLNAVFLSAMCADFERYGAAAIERVRKENPAVYVRVLALLVPREMKIETTGSIKKLSDEQLDSAIAAIKGALEERERAIVDVTPSAKE